MIYFYIKSVSGCQQELLKNRLMGGMLGFHMSFFLFLSGEEGKDIGKAVEVFQSLRVFVICLPALPRLGPGPVGRDFDIWAYSTWVIWSSPLTRW